VSELKQRRSSPRGQGRAEPGRASASPPDDWYREVVDGSPYATLITRADSSLAAASEGACRLTGYSKEELLGMTLGEVCEEAAVSAARSSGKRGGNAGPDGEATVLRKDGTAVDVEFTCWSIEAAGVPYVSTVLRDITACKKREQALLERDEAYRYVVERANDGIAIIQDSLVQYANPRLLELWGGTAEEVIHTAFSRYVAPDELPKVLEHYRQRMAGAPVRSTYETVLLHKDETRLSAELNAGVIPFHGRPADFVFVRDITERKRAEEALRESERRYAALFDHSNDGVFIMGFDLVHRAVNRRGAEILGYEADELVGMTVAETVDPREYPEAVNKRDALLSGEAIGIYQRTFRAKDGSPVPVEIDLTLVRDSAGQPLHIQSIVRDIRERKQSQEALERSAERLRSLTARLAQVETAERRRLARELHDQVGPNLTALGINLNLISSQLPEAASATLRPRLTDSLALLEETAERLRDVMADLRPPVLEDYGLLTALHWYGKQFAARTGIPVSVLGDDLSPRLPLHVESGLFRIAQEALTNVSKHAQAKRVTVAVNHDASRVRLEVADDGIGFEETPPSLQDGRRGWGIVTMAERAESVGGTCQVASISGQGTRVIVEVAR